MMTLGPHPNIDSIIRLQTISITAASAVAQQTIVSITFTYLQSHFLIDRLFISASEGLKFGNLQLRDMRSLVE